MSNLGVGGAVAPPRWIRMLARFATKQADQSQQEIHASDEHAMLGFSGIHNSNKIICPMKELSHILLRGKEG